MRRLENDFTRPVIEHILHSFRLHPIRSVSELSPLKAQRAPLMIPQTYVTIFSCLTVLPALSFVYVLTTLRLSFTLTHQNDTSGFSLFIITSFVGVAITAALVAASAVIAFFGTCCDFAPLLLIRGGLDLSCVDKVVPSQATVSVPAHTSFPHSPPVNRGFGAAERSISQLHVQAHCSSRRSSFLSAPPCS